MQYGLQMRDDRYKKTKETKEKVRQRRLEKRIQEGLPVRKPQIYKCPACKKESGQYTIWESNRHGDDIQLIDFPSYGLDLHNCERHKNVH